MHKAPIKREIEKLANLSSLTSLIDLRFCNVWVEKNSNFFPAFARSLTFNLTPRGEPKFLLIDRSHFFVKATNQTVATEFTLKLVVITRMNANFFSHGAHQKKETMVNSAFKTLFESNCNCIDTLFAGSYLLSGWFISVAFCKEVTKKPWKSNDDSLLPTRGSLRNYEKKLREATLVFTSQWSLNLYQLFLSRNIPWIHFSLSNLWFDRKMWRLKSFRHK